MAELDFDHLDDILGRKTISNEEFEKIKQENEEEEEEQSENYIHYEINSNDNTMVRVFKEFLNSRKDTIRNIKKSGYFKETEGYNIIYALGKEKPQFSWKKAEKLADYYGYKLQINLIPIKGKVREIPKAEKERYIIHYDMEESKRNGDDLLTSTFKEFLNSKQDTLASMNSSGYFKKQEANNIIYKLHSTPKPQFTWDKAEKLADYYGYELELVIYK